jgi:hypothetical protein
VLAGDRWRVGARRGATHGLTGESSAVTTVSFSQCGFDLRRRCRMANSPRGFSGGSGHRKDVHDGGWNASTFDIVDDEFQRLAGDGNR